MLVKLKQRFASWWASSIALVVFAVMFTLAAAVIGPWISGSTDPAQPAVTENVVHDVHHES